MKIDRHNYEEYFLLYVDNELNPDQKKQVDAFVSENPDLEEELVMLQQSKLIPDDSIIYDGKEKLMRQETGIELSNYQEWLLLYVDNELTTEQKFEVEKFAAEHDHVSEELNLFRQAKLDAEEKIIFIDKDSLYRTEKVRVISMRWVRVAAAAVLILGGGFGVYSIINNNQTAKPPIETATVKPDVAPQKNNPQSKVNDQPVEPKHETAATDEKQNENLAGTQKQIKQPKKPVVIPQNNILQKQESVLASNLNEKTLGHESIVTNNTTTEFNPGNNTTAVNVENGKHIFNNSDVTKGESKTPEGYTNVAKTTEPVTEVANNNENKRFRGFFRKATRFIERTTKLNPANDDDKLLIGSVAISLK